MVKNMGGNKSKKQARKTVNESMSVTQGVRRVTNPDEMYASVTKIYSAKRCDVLGSDGITRPCNIRGKFLGRRGGSGENRIDVGSWVMIGFYDWEVRSDGSKSCDLLEIYNAIERDKLKQIETQKMLGAIFNLTAGGGKDCELTFSSFHTGNGLEAIPIADTESDAESNDGSSDEEDEKAPLPPLPVVIKENVETQMDWLNISERDI